MASRKNKILQVIRDITVLISGILLMLSSYGKWIDEPAHYILFGIGVAFVILTLINLLLLIINVKSRAYFYFNTIVQIIPSLLLVGFWGNGLGIFGLAFLVLNISILITLRRGKEK